MTYNKTWWIFYIVSVLFNSPESLNSWQAKNHLGEMDTPFFMVLVHNRESDRHIRRRFWSKRDTGLKCKDKKI